ncbi:MAG TPA: ankyrin repeat domain-containing protein [Candidatus Hydrogenedens sp.]|nr:ankyrin repeat domain-containing protein [Candidatus Hydrogenedens sp.]HOK09833.1 ankyrin repeat domain-containing protein [Candidatus Hydrogenedens sp.]HOL19490.1 ankyrin repeat domain-containing protein [Candidatus Hydrogenedens sp.]HPP59406.1 ankyrin repeat domain-containing protein [Candidatus Hydrogenedens sp.]
MNIFSIAQKLYSPLDKVALSNHPVLFNIMLTTLCEDHGVSTSKISPLHRAVRLGLEEAVESLLQFGSDPNEKNSLGEIPLHVAVRMNRIDLVRILLPYSHINATSHYGLTPLHWACLFGYTPIVELLLLNGADPYIHAVEADGLTPRDFAMLMGQKEVINLIENFAPLR